MKRLSVISFLLFVYLQTITAQKVDSIKVEQAGDLIKIHYQIINSNVSQVFRVTVFCSINGGLESKLKSLSGDFGENVTGGRKDYMVLWDVLKDVDEVKTVDFSVKAELVKDNSPLSKNPDEVNWSTKRIYILPSIGAGDKRQFGLRLSYMGSFGVSVKFLETSSEEFHRSIDLAKRIISKNKFQMHLLTGVSFGNLLVDNNSSFGNSSYITYSTYEIGVVFAIKNFSFSLAITPYKPVVQNHVLWNNIYGDLGIGFRF